MKVNIDYDKNLGLDSVRYSKELKSGIAHSEANTLLFEVDENKKSKTQRNKIVSAKGIIKLIRNGYHLIDTDDVPVSQALLDGVLLDVDMSCGKETEGHLNGILPDCLNLFDIQKDYILEDIFVGESFLENNASLSDFYSLQFIPQKMLMNFTRFVQILNGLYKGTTVESNGEKIRYKVDFNLANKRFVINEYYLDGTPRNVLTDIDEVMLDPLFVLLKFSLLFINRYLCFNLDEYETTEEERKYYTELKESYIQNNPNAEKAAHDVVIALNLEYYNVEEARKIITALVTLMHMAFLGREVLFLYNPPKKLKENLEKNNVHFTVIPLRNYAEVLDELNFNDK